MNDLAKKSSIYLYLSMAMILLACFPGSIEAKEKENVQFVDVNVATLWTEPGLLRPMDAPSASNPADLNGWISNMKYEDKLWLVGNLETQALYGSKVTVLEERNGWVKVAVANQPTPRLETGYPGWMPKEQLTEATAFDKKAAKKFALVTSPKAWLYSEPKHKSRFLEVSFDTRLPVLQVKGDSIKVLTPNDGAKWLDKKNAAVYQSEEDIPEPTGEKVVETGKQFLGLPYLWAGMSGFGYDCSGFTYSMYHANGITIPRDSSVQATHGQKVAVDELQPGDLLFFAYDKGKGRVHHVGMYIGDGKMIHSPNTSTHVRIDDIKTPAYWEEFSGARRYIKD